MKNLMPESQKLSRPVFPLSGNQDGAAMVMGMLVVLAFLFLAVLLLDVGRIQIAGRHIQSIADATALAAVSRLNSEPSGWKYAKRAAINVLRSSSLAGSSAALGSDVNNWHIDTNAPKDDSEVAPAYSSTKYSVGFLDIQIERGYYHPFPSTSSGFIFCRLDETTASPNIRLSGDPVNYLAWNVANAARVTITLNNLRMFFTPIIPGLPLMVGPITRQAVSAREDFVSTQALTSPGCSG